MLTSPQDTHGFKFSTYYLQIKISIQNSLNYSKEKMLDLSLNKKNAYYIYEQIHTNDSITKTMSSKSF